jgi:hypothetical protein
MSALSLPEFDTSRTWALKDEFWIFAVSGIADLELQLAAVPALRQRERAIIETIMPKEGVTNW